MDDKNQTFHLNQKGMTLLEVLIALVVFAIGMLGIANMLLLSNKTNSSSYTKQQAVQCIYDLFDRVRANSSAAISGSYSGGNINTSGAPVPPAQPAVLCNVSACSPTQMAAYDIWYWLTYDVARLPGGSGSISTALSAGAGGNTIVTITVQWDDTVAQANLGNSSTTATANPNFVQLTVQSEL